MPTPIRAASLALVVVAWPGLAAGQALQAARLELHQGALRATGSPRVELAACTLRADELRLTLAPPSLTARRACLEAARLRLVALRLALSPAGLEAQGLRAVLCPCGRWPALRVTARSLRLAAGGRHLHLRWPVLRVGVVPVFAAPYWAVGVRPGASGLLVPSVGYSARDGLRLEQGAYVAAGGADLELAGGWHEGRGALLRARPRYFSERRGDGDLSGVLLRDGGRWRGAVAGRAVVRGEGWTLAVHPDLVSDPAWLRDHALPPDRVFARHLRSRLLAQVSSGVFSAVLMADLLQDLAPPARRAAPLHALGLVRGDVAPTPVWGPLSFAADVRWGGASAAAGTARGNLALAELAPALTLALPLGPLRFSSLVRDHLQVVWRERTLAETSHGVVAVSEMSLPFGRGFGAREAGGPARLWHELEPFVGWHAAAGQPRWTMAGLAVQPREGGFGLVGLRTRLARRRGGHLLALRLALAVGVDGERAGLAEIAWDLGVRVASRSSWDLTRGALIQAASRVCAGPAALSLCAGHLRHRAAAIPLYQEPGLWSGGLAAGIHAAEVTGVRDVDQLHAELRGRYRWLAATAGVFVDPLAGALTHGVYRLDAELGCGCYRLSLLGISRAGQRWPDLLASLSLALGGAGCGMR